MASSSRKPLLCAHHNEDARVFLRCAGCGEWGRVRNQSARSLEELESSSSDQVEILPAEQRPELYREYDSRVASSSSAGPSSHTHRWVHICFATESAFATVGLCFGCGVKLSVERPELLHLARVGLPSVSLFPLPFCPHCVHVCASCARAASSSTTKSRATFWRDDPAKGGHRNCVVVDREPSSDKNGGGSAAEPASKRPRLFTITIKKKKPLSPTPPSVTMMQDSQ
jgi:hypothetical protein